MRLVTLRGRAHVVVGGPGSRATDVHTASGSRFGPGMLDVLREWDAFLGWAATAPAALAEYAEPFDPAEAGPVVDRPGQVFAVGLNYRAHAEESGLPIPEVPLVFTKFPSCIAAPFGDLRLPTAQVDWEVEVTAVIGRTARGVAKDDAWAHVAGITAAQDFSARDVQFAATPPQFSLGKSFPGFLPLGPALVTPDEFPDRDAIALACDVNGTTRQASSTADLIFGVADLVAYLSSICRLEPGDLILTGTPAGVGFGQRPPVYLAPGDEVVTRVEVVGEMRQRCVA